MPATKQRKGARPGGCAAKDGAETARIRAALHPSQERSALRNALSLPIRRRAAHAVTAHLPGSHAALSPKGFRPSALRPTLSDELPFSGWNAVRRRLSGLRHTATSSVVPSVASCVLLRKDRKEPGGWMLAWGCSCRSAATAQSLSDCRSRAVRSSGLYSHVIDFNPRALFMTSACDRRSFRQLRLSG